jgi:flavodoxin
MKSLNSARNVEGDFEMSTLVIYFSQTGTTKAAAEKIAWMKGADLIEIRPEKSYEMCCWKTVFTSLKEIFTKARPKLAMEIPDVEKYDRVLIGCPIWCGLVPNVVLTLLDTVHLDGKHTALFTTSGATKPIKPASKLKKAYPEVRWHKPLNANGVTEEEIRNWM